MKTLEEIRLELDVIDKDIVRLFEERMKLCEDVAKYKIQTGMNVLDRNRENQKLDAVGELANTEFGRKNVRELFRQIMSLSRKLQYGIISEDAQPDLQRVHSLKELRSTIPKVIFQGMEGAYSQAALEQYFGEEKESLHVDTFKDAMEMVSAGQADYAVLPIENSSSGAIHQVYELLVQYNNYIVGETVIPVRHVLAACPGTEIGDIQRVLSHPQGLLQCRHYLEDHRDWQQIGVENTAVAAMRIHREMDRTQAAICSEYAAGVYDLEILERNMASEKDNSTRFIVVSSQKVFLNDADKISICFELPHESGSLYQILSHFIYNDLNMTKIESMPVEGRAFEYRFFIDFEGNLNDTSVRNALCGIAGEAKNLQILGNYL